MNGGRSRTGSCRGFTLVELMVALAVLAIGMSAVLHATNQSARAGVFLKQKTVAHWVASNRAAELSINREWPDPGVIKGTETMAGQTWDVESEVRDTQVPELRLVTIRVLLENEEVASMVTFLERPL